MRLLLSALVVCATGLASEKVEILRDPFGIPHIFARTAAGAAYGAGYAQAADRLDQLLKNLRSAKSGGAAARSPRVRAIVEAYCAGINAYLAETNRGGDKVDAAMVEAFSRSAFGQIQDAGHILIAPSRSSEHAVIAILNPHGDWYALSRPYSVVVYGPEDGLAFAGAGPVGVPFPLMGHSDSLAIAVSGAGEGGSNTLDQAWAMITARNLDQEKAAQASAQLPRQRFLIGTADGDIYDSGMDVRNPTGGVLTTAGAVTRELLGRSNSFSLESAESLAFATDVYKAEVWQDRIAHTAPELSFARMITGWSRRADANSRGALGFYLFKMSLGDDASALAPPDWLSDNRIRAALRKAQDRLETEFPLDATYGTLFRVQREGTQRSWPVGGGTVAEAGIFTPRAIRYARRGRMIIARGGQEAVQVVALSRPVRSVWALPLGESDTPASPHFDDQARDLFSKSLAASEYFGDRKELERHSKEGKTLVKP